MIIESTKNEAKILTALAKTYEEFKKSNDIDNQNKMKELMHKAVNREVQLAFCGHFSAGKSSMINFLMGKKILPSSPIPTSANVVKVKQGKEAVRVYFFDGTHTTFYGAHDMKDIKSYCKDGEQIRSIHIFAEDFPLPEDCAVLDTPGIDSTDDAHRVSTESTLHLADIILYVMDYNHVQSQENFLFAKKMSEAGKQLYLVVNQIDKHDESELSFKDFQDSVKQSFSQWNIEPQGIFYTSLRNNEMAYNEIEELKQFVHEKIQYEREHLFPSILRSAEQISHDHMTFNRQQQAEQIDEAKETLAELQEKELSEVLETLKELQNKKQKLSTFANDFYLQKLDELNVLLQNAYLLTAESRDLIRSFIESQQPSFKVGMFFTKSKTDEERKNREQLLLQELQERTKTQLDWHIRDLAVKSIKGAGVNSIDLEELTQQLSVSIDMDEIKALVKNQSDITGEYVLLFSNQVADVIKQQAKKMMIAFLNELKTKIHMEKQDELTTLELEITELKRYEDASEFLEFVYEEEKKYLKQIQAIINGNVESNEKLYKQVLLEIEQEEQRNEKTLDQEKLYKIEQADVLQTVEVEGISHIMEKKDSIGTDGLQNWSRRLTDAARHLQDVDGFSTIVDELKERAARMKEQTFTIALFGAFSAGKSSFANALFGEKVLPVSPNPTTAVINKVMAAKGDYEHQTALVKLKSKEMLLEDVQLACKELQAYPATLEEAYLFGGRLHEHPTTGDGQEKAHLSFIAAFHKGYDNLRDQLGEELIVNYEDYKLFAADESKSCFVDEITLFYDCDLTRKGIVLVDTPGADSINARHTNAAFHYIKNSDAILFVTYYNHPFAKADREFLIQLGRVKDSFSMDKMFFICNAVDLAQDEEELGDVIHYIKSQLEGFGIRFPRLFPLSSKQALLEQSENYQMEHPFLQNSGMENFQKAFTHFIQHELIDLACTSAQSTIERAVQLLKEIIEASNASSEEKYSRLQKIEVQYDELKSQISVGDFGVEQKRLSKESDELLYYIQQRVFLRYPDFFKESFNPSVLKDDGRDLKAALRKALSELIESTGFDFEQEMRATSVRIEAFVKNLVKGKQQQLQTFISKTWNTVDVGNYEMASYEVPTYNKAFQHLNDGSFKKELSLFRNTKAFFEKNEKQKMAEALKDALQQPSQEYLQLEGNKLLAYYQEILDSELQQLLQFIESRLEDIYVSFTSVLKSDVDITFYEKKEEALQLLLLGKQN